MISRVIRKLGLIVAALALGVPAFAQSGPVLDWGNVCWDGKTTSTDYILYDIGTPLFAAQLTIAGTAPAFSSSASLGSCFKFTTGYWGETDTNSPASTAAASLSFTYGDPFSGYTGEVGSIQTQRDDYMVTSFGAPAFTGNPWSYSMLVVDGAAPTAIPAFTTYFTGQSDRYMYGEVTVGDIDVILRVDIVGDAARAQWRFVNNGTASHTVGLWSGQWSAMMVQPATANGVPQTAGVHPIYIPSYPGGSVTPPYQNTKPLYVTMPHNLPPVTEHRYKRATDSADFPEYVNLLYSQNLPYGLRVENGPYDVNVFDTQVHGGVHDGQQIQNNGADEFVFGSEHYLLGGPTGTGTMPDYTFPEVFPGAGYSDVDPRFDAGYIQKWYDTGNTVAPADERVIIQYYRTTWSNSDYRLPYATVVDAPRMFQPTPGNPSVITPANARVRVNVDNTYGYSNIISGVPLKNVQITLRFAKSSGLKFDQTLDQPQEAVQMFNGVQQVVVYSTKTISQINARRMDFVDFHITPSSTVSGDLPYDVTVTPAPGPVRVITGSIYSSPTPTLALTSGANLVTVPWVFPDNSWTSVLGLAPGSFNAFVWDPVDSGYKPSTTAQRGTGQWLVTKQDFPALSLNSNATIPTDVDGGFTPISLSPGWNLVGNPYNYRIKLGELVGAPQGDTHSYVWNDLVAQAFVSGNVAIWNPNTQSYDFLSGFDAILEPQQGFWIYVINSQNLVLKFPPVYLPGILAPTSRATTTAWNKDTSHWRLNLVAASATSLDDKNYVGQVQTKAEVNTFTALKPPISPVSDVEVAVDQTLNGKTTRAAQAYTTAAAKQIWKVHVFSKDGGRVKLTWPNMAQLNRSLTFRLIDSAAGITRDMRQLSGYDFDAKKGTTRELQIQVATGGSVSAMIGNVLAVRSGNGRGLNSAFAITYSLSGEATTSVRILSATGKEVYAITRGRADKVGENTVTWSLRDNANRAVAPGSYRVEVVAESTTGERSRRVIPINVVR